MIIRDEDGRAIGIEKLSDLTDEIADIEKILNKALKNKKKELNPCKNWFQTLMALKWSVT